MSGCITYVPLPCTFFQATNVIWLFGHVTCVDQWKAQVWQVTGDDKWHVTHDMWHTFFFFLFFQHRCDIWHVTCNTWHMTCDLWHFLFCQFFLFLVGIYAIIRTRWESQCLPYARFSLNPATRPIQSTSCNVKTPLQLEMWFAWRSKVKVMCTTGFAICLVNTFILKGLWPANTLILTSLDFSNFIMQLKNIHLTNFLMSFVCI